MKEISVYTNPRYRKTQIFAAGISVGTSFTEKLFGLAHHVPCVLTILKNLLDRCVPVEPPAAIGGVRRHREFISLMHKTRPIRESIPRNATKCRWHQTHREIDAS